MAGDGLVRMVQIAGAAVGIPAAVAGTYSAYQNYFSTDVACHKLRDTIIATMERNVAPETKRGLLRKDVAEFDKLCGDGDPDAHAIFQAAIRDAEHAATAAAGPAAAATAIATQGEPQRPQAAPVGVFGAVGSKDARGWVALSHKQSGAWVVHFSGYAIAETSLPPAGTVLAAQKALPVWSEPQAGTNDQTKLQSRLRTGSCVRVVATRAGSGRLWAEVSPASCS
jgi:hypothetical protein